MLEALRASGRGACCSARRASSRACRPRAASCCCSPPSRRWSAPTRRSRRYYRCFIESVVRHRPAGQPAVADRRATGSPKGCSAIFFLAGRARDPPRDDGGRARRSARAAILPVVAAVGGVLAPTAIYLALNRGPTARRLVGADGDRHRLHARHPGAAGRAHSASAARLRRGARGRRRHPVGADARDLLSAATSSPTWLGARRAVAVAPVRAQPRARLCGLALRADRRSRSGSRCTRRAFTRALAGVLLAAFLPTRPAPAAGPLLAQAATRARRARACRERGASDAGATTQRIAQEPIWDWASRNLSAASERLLSPADRIERAVAPWSAYVILPLFAFSATGVRLDLDLSHAGRLAASCSASSSAS